MKRAARAAACMVAAFLASAAGAAGPFVVEDAAIVDADACQLEAWTQRLRNGYLNVAQPACNPTGNLEIQVTGARSRADGDRVDLAGIQLKSLLRPVDATTWGVGVVAGFLRGRNRTSGNDATDVYVTVPLSIPLAGDALYANLNAGALRDGVQHKVTGTWGVSLDGAVGDRLRIVGEAFRLAEARPLVQVGGFASLVPQRVELVALYGNRWGGGGTDRWYSVGIQLYSPPFLR